MKSTDTNAGKALRIRKGRPVEDFLKPRIIEVEGNEEFLDRLAAIFVEQVLAAQAQERRNDQAQKEQAQDEQVQKKGSAGLPARDEDERFDSSPEY